MPQIPQGTVDIIRESSDILEVVSQYVDLKQRGSNYFGTSLVGIFKNV